MPRSRTATCQSYQSSLKDSHYRYTLPVMLIKVSSSVYSRHVSGDGGNLPLEIDVYDIYLSLSDI